MSSPQAVIAHTAQLQAAGKRRILLISGDAEWSLQQARNWIAMLPGDWMWLGDAPQSPLHCTPAAARTLLGREFLHAVFDARTGFNADALAALSGTLKAGSWLVILTPALARWAELPDHDSLRWSESAQPIPAPYFFTRLQHLIAQDPEIAILRQHQPLHLPAFTSSSSWQPNDTTQQDALRQQLLSAAPGVFVVIAPRGRGKSALAGSLAAAWPGRCVITAPAKVSTDVLAAFAGGAFEFIAPDRLLALPEADRPQQVDWLIIDEAAAIPAPLLHALVALYPRTLLTTTLQGYEGTGRGFLLKFCASLPHATVLKLDAPLRWSAGDPLERFINRTLLFEEAEPHAAEGQTAISFPEQAEWQSRPARLEAIYRLLTSAHYRTSPLDLRRMMDAPGMHFIAAMQGDAVQGAAWLVDEGGLSAPLAAAVWAGFRRPRGNLVAQSLAAHAGFPEAAEMHSRRISRIAVTPGKRRAGLGQNMVQHSLEQAAGLDFVSVSFGYTEALWHFWQACGFTLVRIGTQREASSGCYPAMAIAPLSAAGRQLAQQASARLAAGWCWLQPLLTDCAPAIAVQPVTPPDAPDWRELAGFAWGQRTFEAGIGALGRLVTESPDACPLLRAVLTGAFSAEAVIAGRGLSGRKALITAWRQEVQQALMARDPQRSQREQQWIRSLK